jgi:four helix bundle protein
MSTVKRFEDLEVWKSSRQLTTQVYELCRQAPFSKDNGLKDQICRAALSVMSNIAEGFESQTQSQFIRYLGIAKASAGETRSQLYIALDLRYISKEQFDQAYELADKTIRQLYRFMDYLKNHPGSRHISEEKAEYKLE